MTSSSSITVLLFGVAKALASSRSELTFPSIVNDNGEQKITPKVLKHLLLLLRGDEQLQAAVHESSRKEWRDVIETSALAVNQEYVDGNWENDQLVLTSKMEIAVIPTVSGG